MITCDTHALIYWALTPERLSPIAANTISQYRTEGELACSDIVLWEVAMLAAKGRIRLSVEPTRFIQDIIQALRLVILPITVEIAVNSHALPLVQGDPADRLIVATALYHRAPLITIDERIRNLTELSTIW